MTEIITKPKFITLFRISRTVTLNMTFSCMILCYLLLLPYATFMILCQTLYQIYAHLAPRYVDLGFSSGKCPTNKPLVNASNLYLTDYVENQEYM